MPCVGVAVPRRRGLREFRLKQFRTEDMIRSRWETPNSSLSTTSRSESRPSMAMHNIAAPRKLRKINLPDIQEEHLKGHQLYKYLKDCQHQGLLLTFRGGATNHSNCWQLDSAKRIYVFTMRWLVCTCDMCWLHCLFILVVTYTKCSSHACCNIFHDCRIQHHKYIMFSRLFVCLTVN